MKSSYVVTTLCIINVFLFGHALLAVEARATLKVVGDDGKPIGAFPVIAGFYAGDNFQGVTDTNGIFEMEGKAGHWEADWILQN